MDLSQYDAAIFDMDGVLTQTAAVHARAWKEMFDEYLMQRSEREGRAHGLFDLEEDYLRYADGKPRYDGVRSFLQARGIELPEGDEEDEPGMETICGLGNRKNDLFLELIRREGVEVYDDALEHLRAWKSKGVRLAVISSSRNCTEILKSAQVLELFDAKVDGTDLEPLQLAGKPAPDIFLQAARELEVDPARAMIFEDSIAGVQAGRAGGFGLVVGVARSQQAEKLRQRGAHLVVHNFRELQATEGTPDSGSRSDRTPKSALQYFNEFASLLEQRNLALFLDYDGTLTPIVDRPDQAVLPEEMRALLKQLAGLCKVAIISGRDRVDVQSLIQLDSLIYAGSHGFDIAIPRELQLQHNEAEQYLSDLDAAEQKLREQLEGVEGTLVERKRYAIAVHYRLVAEEEVETIEEKTNQVAREHPRLRKKDGKKIIELQPDVEWDKGRAVLWLREALKLKTSEFLTLYVGDDVTDEDAFRALAAEGVGVGIVVAPQQTTEAHYSLQDCSETQQFLAALLDLLEKRKARE